MIKKKEKAYIVSLDDLTSFFFLSLNLKHFVYYVYIFEVLKLSWI